VSDEWGEELDERRALIRQVRQRLESLGRAGLVYIHARSNPKPTERVTIGLRARGSGAGPDASLDEGIAGVSSVERRPEPVTTPSVSPPLPAVAKPVAAPVPRSTAAASVPLSRTSLFGESGFETPPVPASDRLTILTAAAAEVAVCTRCPHLAETRTKTVFGTGSPTARLMFIGEAPGADEDRIGQPFVGRAGQLLTDMITKGMGLSREDVYIANVIKCRPPDNRTPTPEEAANCSSYLDQQIAVIRPEFLCLLGKTAAIALLDVLPTTTMGPLRKRWHSYKGIRTLVTYHPSYLLRTQSAKKDAWEDLQLLMKEMGIQIPGRRNRE
jgi:uracil-DNA glycosylase family 4